MAKRLRGLRRNVHERFVFDAVPRFNDVSARMLSDYGCAYRIDFTLRPGTFDLIMQIV